MGRCRGQQGQTEVVIVFPVVMLLVLLIIQGALWFLGHSIAMDCAQDGARAAAFGGGSPVAGQTAATDTLAQLSGSVLSQPRVSVAVTGGRAQVTVTGRAESILPGWALTVTATVAQPVEEFRP